MSVWHGAYYATGMTSPLRVLAKDKQSHEPAGFIEIRDFLDNGKLETMKLVSDAITALPPANIHSFFFFATCSQIQMWTQRTKCAHLKPTTAEPAADKRGGTYAC